MNRVLPRALRPGDPIAVLAPASGVRDADALQRGLARWRQWGFLPELLPHATSKLDWPAGGPLAATDALRLADLQEAISNERYRAIVAVRGGYGTARLLPHVDLAPLRRDPKPILGYSDLTALLAAVWRDGGLVGFHGPMLATTAAMDPGPDGWALQRRLLTDATAAAALPAAEARGLCPGTAEGPLLGGNLALVQSLLGTPWQLDTTGALLVLEDIGEAPYRVDRMLTQLRQAGVLDRAAGVVLGDFHVDGTELGSAAPAMTRVLDERLADLPIPVALGFPIGHRPGAWTLPFGVRARLAAPGRGEPATLQLLEPAVRA
ncbi:MAG: LD-carboxypeptidase [Planctomycetota bacterium]